MPKTDSSIIINELKKFNITPATCSELITRNSDPNNCLYILQFANNDVSLAQIRKVRAIDHVIVTWKPFISRSKGPTQCRKCTMFSHGAENCHRSLACLICAGTDHSAEGCAFKEATPEAFICFNCVAKILKPITKRMIHDAHVAQITYKSEIT